MTAQGMIEFANLNVTYPDASKASRHVGLLDKPEYVLPLFFEGAPRKLRKNSPAVFFFHNAQALEVEAGVYAIAFEFVRVRDLKSHHRWETSLGAMVQKERQLPNDAGSSVGLLVLNDHTLAYVGKTPYAPSMDQLRATLRAGARRLRDAEVTASVEGLPIDERATAMRAGRLARPLPRIDIVPVKAKSNLIDALNEFKVLRRVEIQVVAPNGDEMDSFEGFIGDVYQARLATGATTITVTQANKAGLDKEAVKKEFEQLNAERGGLTTHVSMRGLGHQDEKMSRMDENVAVTEQAEFPLIGSASAVAAPLLERLRDALERGAQRTNAREKAKAAWEWLAGRIVP